jgi:hypothetical protein
MLLYQKLVKWERTEQFMQCERFICLCVVRAVALLVQIMNDHVDF